MTFYDILQAENEEIQKHKYCRSKEVGHDIGFEQALFEWVTQHREKWLAECKERQKIWASAEFMPWP